MKKLTRYTSLLLVFLMLLGIFASCTPGQSEENDSSTESNNTESEESQESESSEDIIKDADVLPAIKNANALANGVNAYFEQGTGRKTVIIENLNMTLKYGVSSFYDQQVSSMQNKNGGTYIEDTFDVFVKTDNGTFYASNTTKPTTMNLYRFGYYMYEVRLEEQDFFSGISEKSAQTIEDLKPQATNNIKFSVENDGSLSLSMRSSDDPFVVFKNISYSADTYKFIQITIKSEAKTTRSASFYYKKNGDADFKGSQKSSSIYMLPDGEYHTYLVPLNDDTNYSGDITGLRLDLDAEKNESFNIKEIKLIEADSIKAPDLSVARSFFTYSDKMHHLAQVVAHTEVNGIKEIGMITKISADKVVKLIVKDKNEELHTTIEGVDWSTAEYIGFDVKDAGIFGYIIPVDETSGTMKVTIEDGYYVITQSRTPENGTVLPSEKGTRNANDFYMGQRIYTDSTHDFADFLHEAYCERNPLSIKRFKLNENDSISDAEIVGYDPIRGAYKFTLEGARGFLTPQTQTPNKHFNVSFSFNGDDVDRKVYFYSSTLTGNLECAVLLNENDMLLPIPIEVGKNFNEGETGERNIYNLDDATYGEAIFPMIIGKGEKATYTLVHLYQNWGNYPLKQISWIQYHSPYYHLSTGTTETNCIVPYYSTKAGKASLDMLPDHRAWSAPLWEGDPQHTSGGNHTMLAYTDSEGKFYTSDNTVNVIGSYGPTYADVTMYHTSDDGRIKYSISHMEMPQTDENRAYYEFRYEVVEDLTINNFKQDFSFYSVTDNAGEPNYTKLGYLNENNECTVVDANTNASPQYYVLGDECPYFDYFNIVGYTNPRGYVNVSFLIYSSDITIGGKKCDASFVVKEVDGRAYLSLDLEKITLKAGDTFTINAIIMPWGSQESEYPAGAPDYNVRDVRENTLLNPVKATPVENCEIIESVYLPKINSTNGKTSTFTISGGHNNIAVRVYGFDKLTAPKLYEIIDGKPQEIVLSSSASPDKMGNYRYYDGYNVYYDGDGTYSYSFVTTMSNGESRTFMIDASADFERWPKIDSESPNLLDFYLDPIEISNVILYPEQFSKIGIENEEFDFISFYGNSHIEKLTESYCYAYIDGQTPTGGFLALKYRLPKTNPDAITDIEFYISTQNERATNSSDSYWVTGGLVNDGEWHVLILDIPSFAKSTFTDNGNGGYLTKYIRIDPFNKKVSNDTRLDIAYIGMAYSREDIFAICNDMESVTVCKNSSTNIITIDPKTGEILSGEDVGTNDPTTTDPSIDLYITPTEIEAAIEDIYQFAKIEQKSEGGLDFISFYGNSHKDFLNESYFTAYKGGTKATGSYLALKYRLPSTNTEQVKDIEFYLSTINAAATSADSFYISGGLINDGKWHVLIVDLASFEKATFAKNDNGEYTAKFVRVDPFNGKFSAETRIDIAYIGLSDTLQEMIAFNKNLETVTVYNKKAQTPLMDYDTATGAPKGDVIEIPSSVKMFYSGTSLKTLAEGNLGKNMGKVTVSDDTSFVTFNSKAGAGESYVLFHHNPAGSVELGQYMFIKYRTSLSGERFEIYSSTSTETPANTSMLTLSSSDRGYINDGEWHLLIIDLSTLAGYSEGSDGKYYPKHFRFDIFNTAQSSSDNSVDIAYIGIGTNADDIVSMENTLESVLIYDSNGIRTVSSVS